MRLGDFYSTQGDHEKAVPMIMKAEHLLDSLGMQRARCSCKYSLASSLVELIENQEKSIIR